MKFNRPFKGFLEARGWLAERRSLIASRYFLDTMKLDSRHMPPHHARFIEKWLQPIR